MHRVDRVEQQLQRTPADEAALAAVHPYRQEGERAEDGAPQARAADDEPRHGPPAQQLQRGHAAQALHPVVAAGDCQYHEQAHYREAHARALGRVGRCLQALEGAQSQVGEGERHERSW